MLDATTSVHPTKDNRKHAGTVEKQDISLKIVRQGGSVEYAENQGIIKANVQNGVAFTAKDEDMNKTTVINTGKISRHSVKMMTMNSDLQEGGGIHYGKDEEMQNSTMKNQRLH